MDITWCCRWWLVIPRHLGNIALTCDLGQLYQGGGTWLPSHAASHTSGVTKYRSVSCVMTRECVTSCYPVSSVQCQWCPLYCLSSDAYLETGEYLLARLGTGVMHLLFVRLIVQSFEWVCISIHFFLSVSMLSIYLYLICILNLIRVLQYIVFVSLMDYIQFRSNYGT